jgi:hypothetical protein
MQPIHRLADTEGDLNWLHNLKRLPLKGCFIVSSTQVLSVPSALRTPAAAGCGCGCWCIGIWPGLIMQNYRQTDKHINM